MLTALLALCAYLSRTDCGACAVRAEKVALCADHAREELLVLKRERRNFEKAATDEDRLAALRTIAALTDAHANAPSPAVPKALAMGLADPSALVGAQTLALFAPPQNPRAVLDVLLETHRDLLPRSRILVPKAGDPSLKKIVRDSQKAIDEIEEKRPLLRAVEGIERHLANFPDERVVKALREDLRLPSYSAVTLACLGSRTALEPLRRALEAHEELLSVAWKPRKDGTRSEEPHPGAELIAALEALAARHGLAPVPEDRRRSCKDWSAWIETHRSTFPERLPGVGVLPVTTR